MKNQTITIIFFLTTVLVFLYIANFVVFEALKLVLQNTIPSWFLISVLAVFGLSFIVSLIIGRNYYSIFTKIYTYVSMIWTGFFAYLFLASVLYIVEVGFIGDPNQIFAIILFGSALLVSIYGISHAKKIVIKTVPIKLTHLPDIWKGRKMVFISDLHIGQINGKPFVEKIVREIQHIAPDIVCIGGDLFDGSAQEKILESIMPFKNLHVPLGIFFVMGNHEGYGTAAAFLQKIKEVGITTLRDEKVEINGLQIVGVDFITTAEKNDFKKVLESIHINTSVPTILLKHEPRYIDVAEQAGISLLLSGHTHKAQQWPFEYLARMVYGRFTYGLNRSNSMYVYTSSGVGTWGPPLRVKTESEIVVFMFK